VQKTIRLGPTKFGSKWIKRRGQIYSSVLLKMSRQMTDTASCSCIRPSSIDCQWPLKSCQPLVHRMGKPLAVIILIPTQHRKISVIFRSQEQLASKQRRHKQRKGSRGSRNSFIVLGREGGSTQAEEVSKWWGQGERIILPQPSRKYLRLTT
jgi:hypothetical protein